MGRWKPLFPALRLAGIFALLAAGEATSSAADKPAVPTAEIQRLIRLLGDDAFEVRETSSRRLIAIGRPALPQLEQASKRSDDAEVSRRAQLAIAGIKNSLAYLLDDLTDAQPAVRCEAARKLGALGPAGKPAIPAVIRLLKDPDDGVRDAALSALIELDSSSEAIGKLIPPNAGAQGKYRKLLRRIKVPADRQTYKDYCDYGRFEGTSWAGHENLPPGFWVYVYPYWFIWEAQAR